MTKFIQRKIDMRHLIACLLFSFTQSVFAAPVILNYDAVELPRVIQQVYSQVVKVGYVISPSVLSNTRKVTINTTIQDPADFPAFFESFLQSNGVFVTKRDGTYYFDSIDSRPATATTSDIQQTLKNELQRQSLPIGLPVATSDNPQQLIDKDFFVYTPKAISADILCGYVNALFTAKSCEPSGLLSVLSMAPAHINKAKVLLPELDKKVPRVLVSFNFLEVASGESKNYGLSLAGSVLGNAFKFAPGTATGGALSITGTNSTLVLDQLLTDSRFKQITSPSALVLAGERFTINVGDRQPTLGAVVTTGTGQSSQSIVYQNSGVILDVLPSVVASDGVQRVYLDLLSELSSFKQTSTGVNNSPTLSQRKIKTTISMQSDEVFVLGGLTTRSTTQGDTRFLGIPVGSSSSTADTDLLLVLSAKVVD